MQLFPNIVSASKELPISVYESLIDIIDGRAQTMFVRAQYRVETMEAERIAVNHVAKAAAADASEGSGVIQHLVGQKNAIKMLHSRIKLLYEYVSDVENGGPGIQIGSPLDLTRFYKGVVEKDHNLMRQISSLCCRLPTIDSPQFRQEFLTDLNDVLLTSYLATLTKGFNTINDVVEKFVSRTSGHDLCMLTRSFQIQSDLDGEAETTAWTGRVLRVITQKIFTSTTIDTHCITSFIL